MSDKYRFNGTQWRRDHPERDEEQIVKGGDVVEGVTASEYETVGHHLTPVGGEGPSAASEPDASEISPSDEEGEEDAEADEVAAVNEEDLPDEAKNALRGDFEVDASTYQECVQASKAFSDVSGNLGDDELRSALKDAIAEVQ